MDWKSVWTNFGVKAKNWSGWLNCLKHLFFGEISIFLYKNRSFGLTSCFSKTVFCKEIAIFIACPLFSRKHSFLFALSNNIQSLEKCPVFRKVTVFHFSY